MKKIYQEPRLEVVKIQTMRMLAVSLKDGEVSDLNDLLAPEMGTDMNWDFILIHDDIELADF